MKPLSERTAWGRDLPYIHDGTGVLPALFRRAVMLLGSFDGMHRGHAALAAVGHEKARENGVPLSIMQCDPHPRAYFAGPSRFRVSTGRAQMGLLADAGIDYVYAPHFDASFAGMSPEAFVQDVLLDHLGVADIVVGEDFRFGCARRGDVSLLMDLSSDRSFNVTVVGDEKRDGHRISTSAVRKAIVEGDITAAEQLLGHNWVTEIRRVGSKWQFKPDQILPPPGSWPVLAYDHTGQWLAECRLELEADGCVYLNAPAETAIVAWRSYAFEGTRLKPESRKIYA